MASSSKPTVSTFANQDALPRLPIPPLDKTLAKYRTTLLPILTPAELARTDAAIKQFVESGQAAELQQRLIAHDQGEPNSWLERWWYDRAYLEWRVPLMINSNWWLNLKDDHLPEVQAALDRKGTGEYTPVQVRRAAGLVSNLLSYKELLDTGKIPAETTKAGPLCMDQVRHMFGVTRIAEPGRDRIQRAFPCPARHMVVIARDQCYEVPLYDAHGRRLALSVLEKLLNDVVADVTSTPVAQDQAPIPVLTAEHRDTWAAARAHLLSLAPENRASMKVIEDALFTVSLDDKAPGNDIDEHHRLIAHGNDGHNRWYDKALNVIVTSSGRAGCNGEHSPQDALTPAVMFQHVIQNEPARDPAGAVASSAGLAVRKLTWKVDAKIDQHITDAEVNNRKLIADSDIGICIFHGYGSSFMKSAGFSPDAYMQMAIQLAMYRQSGKTVPTYETASTRMFKHGRTETCRSLSSASKAWVEAMGRNAQKDAPVACPKQRLAMLKAAAKSHITYIGEASRGLGVDRHLMGLRFCMKPGESCALFEDPAYARSCEWLLSTSGLGAESYKVLYGTGFGCVYPNGYGINYFAGPNVIHFGIESKRSCLETSTDLFRYELLAALREMKALVEAAQGVPTPRSNKL
ncbi:hypothetical protein GGF32_002758 [Allomyces javanicus]|nr:hypothetical protein GGF32_002758 [Allomyces javanicus]